ncbi:hypothetical protein BDZ94DRAFT_1326481 [Collybia nuda]|uniref:FAD dependent oxidoreductase domain-containing protein n=1 Tax=Collybia nuda TaxID=64659 RepID=A0A9P5XX14_9AGAR|nr:hypothetical protein BDZ94DRAFT_1326481 [Collybia nuda]
MASSIEQVKEIVVLGAGVIGLTTALVIQEKGGYHVTIVAEMLPSDSKSIKYTSHWAGAHHVSLAGDDVRQQNIDRETFKKMWEMSAPGGPAEGCFLRITEEELYCQERIQPDPLGVMPDFKILPRESLILDKVVHGTSFSTLTVDTPVYLNYILGRFLAAGGSIIRGTVQHINQVVEGGVFPFSAGRRGPRSPDAVVVCVGLGARTLGGVEDKNMYPIRGQTVLLRAPWIRFGRTMSEDEKEIWTYVIPRRRGDVIVGGTKGVDDWYPVPRAETTRDILERALVMAPELAPPEIRATRKPTIDDLYSIIIEEGTGLRPARHGGIRLEVEWAELKNDEKKLPIVHNYGHAGSGFQASWGSASIALNLLEGALAE